MDKKLKMLDLQIFAAEIRLETLKIIGSRGFGHVGGSLSIVETMAVLYGDIMNVDPENPDWEDRDWMVLSKGHGGPVMYAALGLKGYYPVADAYQLNRPHSHFPSHTDHRMTLGVDLTTGSLGQGMSEAVGAALGIRQQNKKNRVYVIIGDGECDEGEIWEAAAFAAHYKLDNLMCFVDVNQLQLDGPTNDIMSHGKGLKAKFDSFGWNVSEVSNGNDVEQIFDAVQTGAKVKDMPTVVILHTKKGKGAFFAEESGAHTSQPSKAEWDRAIAENEKVVESIKRTIGESKNEFVDIV